MPIAGVLIGPTLLVVPSAPKDRGLGQAQAALGRLAEQRQSLLYADLPALRATWTAAGGAGTLESYRGALETLAGTAHVDVSNPPADHELLRPVTSPDASPVEVLSEVVRLKAIERVGEDGLRAFARARLRLLAMGRRIEKYSGRGLDSTKVARLLAGSSALAATAAAAALEPAIAADGAVSRRFIAALRQLRA